MNRDFVGMLSALSAAGAEFLLVGAYALAAHGLPRATGDIDLWIRPEARNSERVWRALVAFGAPLQDLTQSDLSTPGVVFQIGVAPNRIDIIISIDGVTFDQAWATRVETTLGGQRVPVIGVEELLLNKRATGRPKGRLDADWLEKHRKKR